MYITTDNIYCAQWLVNETLKNYCKKKNIILIILNHMI